MSAWRFLAGSHRKIFIASLSVAPEQSDFGDDCFYKRFGLAHLALLKRATLTAVARTIWSPREFRWPYFFTSWDGMGIPAPGVVGACVLPTQHSLSAPGSFVGGYLAALAILPETVSMVLFALHTLSGRFSLLNHGNAKYR